MTDEYGISIADLLAAVKRARYWVIAFAAGFCVLGLVYSLLATPVYTAQTTLVAADSGGSGGILSQLPAGAASLAAMVGLTAGGGADLNSELAVLGSRELATKFIAEQHMLPYLFPAGWDEETHGWKQAKPGVMGRLLASMKGGDDPPQNTAPTAWSAYREFSKLLKINSDIATGTVIVSFDARDPDLAAKWANAYVVLANSEIRKHTVQEATQVLTYLEDRVRTTSIVGLKDTMYSLIEKHLEQIALANANSDYPFRVIDKALSPDLRSWPKRKRIVLVSLFVGAVVGLFLGLFRQALH